MSNKKFFYACLGIVLLLGLVIFFLTISHLSTKPVNSFEECAASPGSKVLLTYPGQCLTSDGKKFIDQKNINIANPASVNCIKQGNKLEIRTDKQGNQYGICIFPDGKECEEWAFFRGECGQIAQFCGSSTKGKCTTNTDCITGGCSGQVCQSSSEESIVSTCEYQDCYDAQKFGLACQCSNQQCQWAK